MQEPHGAKTASSKHNMRFVTLTRVYDFLQVLGVKRYYLTKDKYFYKQEYLSMIYQLQNSD
jgi:hypothetical protein